MRTLVTLLCQVIPLAAGAQPADQPSSPSKPRTYALDAQQLSLFKAAYPGARILFDCAGNFSGASDHEHVLGIALPARPPVRIGLTLDNGKWILHDIEHELKVDPLPRHYARYDWDPPPNAEATKCKGLVNHDPDLSNNGKLLQGAPVFGLRPGQATACFATSQQYNNWDCLAYRKGQFRLWYQQVFAD